MAIVICEFDEWAAIQAILMHRFVVGCRFRAFEFKQFREKRRCLLECHLQSPTLTYIHLRRNDSLYPAYAIDCVIENLSARIMLSGAYFLLAFASISFLHSAASRKPSIGIVDEKVRITWEDSLVPSWIITSFPMQAFHLEVVGGLLHVLAPYADSTTVYLHPLNFPVGIQAEHDVP